MISEQLIKLISAADQLTIDDQLQLIAHLEANIQHAQQAPDARPDWRAFEGSVAYPFFGEDAQAWVSRTRQEGTEERERQWRDRP